MNTRRILAPLTLAVALASCAAPGRNLVVDVASAPEVPPAVRMGAEVGRLLSPDPSVSKAAERRLMALDDESRDRFVAYAATLGGERDVRLLNVLDEHHALPEMPVEDTFDFLLWKAARPERFYVMKAQSRLMDLARREPDAAIARVRRAGPGLEVLAVVLALNGERRAIPALLERYRAAADRDERAAAGAALARLTDGAVRPRTAGPAAEIERDAEAVEAWYGDLLEEAAEAAEAPGEQP